MQLVRSERASASLMQDLKIDKGMGWMPKSMWLTFIRLAAPANTLGYDLAIDATGQNQPSPASLRPRSTSATRSRSGSPGRQQAR
ncbi:MAG: hypothetical protein E6G46_11250 [Actinobacteria bacterium]|nr:MAG: hypothetical protein E6G46_11250 [Actinomycetota bacterium]